MKPKTSLDATDRKILRELQGQGRLSNIELASRIGLSAPPTLRRVQALEQAGYVKGYRAQLNAEKLGFDIQMFAFVGLKSQNEAELKAFEARVAGWPLVREAYAISGEADFILHLVGSELNELQQFVIATLTAAANVDSVKTTMIMRVAKVRTGCAAGMREASTSSQGNWITLDIGSAHCRCRWLCLHHSCHHAGSTCCWCNAKPAGLMGCGAVHRHGDHVILSVVAAQNADHHRMVDARCGADCNQRFRY